MMLAGLTYGSIVASSFSRAQSKIILAGYPNDGNTFVMISGIDLIELKKEFWLGVIFT